MQIEDDILELGAVSTETLGRGLYPTDEIAGQPVGGLSDD